MYKNDYEVFFSQYVLSLLDNSTTDEMRTNILNAEGFYGKEDLLGQILTAFMQMIVDFDLSIEDAVARIHEEYDAFEMADEIGDFAQFENIVLTCAKAMAKGGGCLAKCYDITEGIDNMPAAAQVGISVAVLRYLTFARHTVSNLPLVRKLLAYVSNALEDTPHGADGIKYMAETVINNKKAASK